MSTVLFTRVYQEIREKRPSQIAKKSSLHAENCFVSFFRFLHLKLNHGRFFLIKSVEFPEIVHSFRIILETILGFLILSGVLSQSSPSVVSKILQEHLCGTVYVFLQGFYRKCHKEFFREILQVFSAIFITNFAMSCCIFLENALRSSLRILFS